MPNPFPLSDPFATDEHRRWVGRKEANLRRRLLDCECPNRGEVYFHLWCDRLACQEHADAPHDCGLFKGKSGIEEEAVEPEAVVDPPTPRPLTLSPETYRALYGQDVAVVSMPATAMVHYELHQPEGAAPLVAEIEAPEPIGAQVTVMTEAEAAGFRARQQLSLECSRSRPLCSGCDGLAMDNFPCVHDCHEPAVCSCPEVDVSTFTDRSTARRFRQGYDPGCRVHAAPSAPPVDAALQPDPDALRHAVSREEIQQLWDQMGFDDEPIDPRPWWRRYLPGGAR